MKTIRILITLCISGLFVILTAFSCESDTYSYTQGCEYEDGKLLGHSAIHFVNNSDNPVWLEWNPRYPMSETDSLFSGFQVRIKNNDSFDLMPLKSECWEGELKKNPFVRIFLFDAPYNSISNNPDSLLRFQQEHLIDMHWYTKKELDSLNWTIHFPIQ